ncbi:MAG: hypothetical protein NVSMB55_13010 [Mycobacteriales bacterium]
MGRTGGARLAPAGRTPLPASFSAQPARQLMLDRAAHEQVPLTELAQRLRLPRRTLHRVLGSSELRWDTADRVAVALGRHPSELWPGWFGEVEPDAVSPV